MVMELWRRNTSTDQNPTHTYTTPGQYTVSLTAGNNDGNNTLTQTNYINIIYPVPVASFTANITSGTAPLNIQFNDQSTGNITSYNWSFGDGATSTEQTQHTHTPHPEPTKSQKQSQDQEEQHTNTKQPHHNKLPRTNRKLHSKHHQRNKPFKCTIHR